MPDGKALQAGTSHDLGQNFSNAEAFDINFQDENGEVSYAWQTSFGLSTRILGGLIMTHGDNDGLVLPPKVATHQVVIVAAREDETVLDHCQQLSQTLSDSGVRARFARHTGHSLGWKLNEAEIKGYPVIMVVGPREIENKSYSVKLRHSGEELDVKQDDVVSSLNQALHKIQRELFDAAQQRRDAMTHSVDTYNEFKQIMKTQRGFIKALWCENESCETAIKEETKATTRCLPFTDNDGSVAEESGSCIKCGQDANHRWLFAQAY
jgi:prolyl-tRNA synthetase